MGGPRHSVGRMSNRRGVAPPSSSMITSRTFRAERPGAALRQHVGHGFGRTGEHRLDRSVSTVAHPAGKFERPGGIGAPGAIADALHPAADAHANAAGR